MTEAIVTDQIDLNRDVASCEGIVKYFGGVQALADVSLTLRAGEVLCLVGDNGAGKSTLTKMFSGQLRPDAGTIGVEGEEPRSHMTVRSAIASGIAVVPQALALCDNLDVASNVLLGCEPVRARIGPFRLMDSRGAVAEARRRVAEVGSTIERVDQPVRDLSGGQRQAVAIARAMVRGRRLIIFDEPTAALGVHQTKATLDLIRDVAGKGVAVLVVTHSLPDVMAIADRVVALRHGEVILSAAINETDGDEVADAMGLGAAR